jgi:hypothetical protein
VVQGIIDVLGQPPELEILDIGDLALDRFRGIFRLTYSGDAYIVLQTKVQVRTWSSQRKGLIGGWLIDIALSIRRIH